MWITRAVGRVRTGKCHWHIWLWHAKCGGLEKYPSSLHWIGKSTYELWNCAWLLSPGPSVNWHFFERYMTWSSYSAIFFLFWYLLYITFIHAITFIQYIHPTSFVEVPLHLLIAGKLRVKNLSGMPSWESNLGLHYQLSYGAPLLSYAAPQLSYTTPNWAKPLLLFTDTIDFYKINKHSKKKIQKM